MIFKCAACASCNIYLRTRTRDYRCEACGYVMRQPVRIGSSGEVVRGRPQKTKVGAV